MNPIDVHILHTPNENQQWRAQCDESLIGHPINTHHIPGIIGDVRQSRRNGFSQGNAPYVSFVDPDDYVEPGVFQRCLDELLAYPSVCGVYTLSNKIIVNADGTESPPELLHNFQQWPLPVMGRLLEIHQIVVMKRECVKYVFDHHFDEIPKMQHAETWMYWNMATRSPWRAIDFAGYNWRVRSDGAHTILSSGEDKKRAATYIKQVRRSLFGQIT